MANSNIDEEVKDFSETVHVVPSKDDELIDEELENETPSSSSDEEEIEPEVEPEIEEEETPIDEEPTPVAETPKPEPKPVAGETPRERALRLEATRLKGLLREQRKEELFVKQPSIKDEDLSGFDPEEVQRFETLISKLGYAKKEELTQNKNNDEFETFINAHPEYSPENDPDGVLWGQFKAEFGLYTPPKDPLTLRKVLNKVHNVVYGVQPAKNLNKVSASQEKIKVASHTGASTGNKTVTPKKQNNSGLRLDGMKGFTQEEIDELLG